MPRHQQWLHTEFGKQGTAGVERYHEGWEERDPLGAAAFLVFVCWREALHGKGPIEEARLTAARGSGLQRGSSACAYLRIKEFLNPELEYYTK